MYTSYSVVNNTYSQVTDRAKISSAGRDVVEMIPRDIRMAIGNILVILLEDQIF